MTSETPFVHPLVEAFQEADDARVRAEITAVTAQTLPPQARKDLVRDLFDELTTKNISLVPLLTPFWAQLVGMERKNLCEFMTRATKLDRGEVVRSLLPFVTRWLATADWLVIAAERNCFEAADALAPYTRMRRCHEALVTAVKRDALDVVRVLVAHRPEPEAAHEAMLWAAKERSSSGMVDGDEDPSRVAEMIRLLTPQVDLEQVGIALATKEYNRGRCLLAILDMPGVTPAQAKRWVGLIPGGHPHAQLAALDPLLRADARQQALAAVPAATSATRMRRRS